MTIKALISKKLLPFMKKSFPVLKSLWFLMIVLLVIVGRALPLSLLIGLVAIAIGIPLIREFFIKNVLDERQIQIGHHSSHFAYFTYTILLLFIIIRELVLNGQIEILTFTILLIVPLIFKMILGLIQKYGSGKGLRHNLLLLFRGLIPFNKADERQEAIGNLSSHIAFYVFVILTLMFIFIQFIKKGENPPNLWYMLLIVPLLIKLFSSFLMTYGAIAGARFIGFTIVSIFFLFILLSHGISLGTVMESIPFLIVFIFLMLAGKYPRIAGTLLILVAVALTIFFRSWRNMDIFGRILMFALIPIPVLICGAALFFPDNPKFSNQGE
ncbi:hypothetical protein JW964_21520 [candidate division KSB1 bacterium]|nr:hypothetical protein [candidate division KSB1 bacterium]